MEAAHCFQKYVLRNFEPFKNNWAESSTLSFSCLPWESTTSFLKFFSSLISPLTEVTPCLWANFYEDKNSSMFDKCKAIVQGKISWSWGSASSENEEFASARAGHQPTLPQYNNLGIFMWQMSLKASWVFPAQNGEDLMNICNLSNTFWSGNYIKSTANVSF